MNPDEQALTLDESFRQVIQTLPLPIRNYLAERKYSAVAQALATKYGLHIDQSGILEREIMLLLMGIENPEEFTQSLVQEANISEQAVSSIVQDVNSQIFVPLQSQMRNIGSNTQQSTRPPAAQSTTPRPANMQAPRYYAPPPQSPKYFHLDNKLPTSEAPSAAPPRPATPGVATLPPKNILPRPSAPSAPVVPRPMNKMLADHEEAHIEVANPAPTPPAPPIPSSPPPPAPSAKPELRGALRTVLPPSNGNPGGGKPPPNLPGAMPPSDLMPPTPKPPPTPYPVDPYREPI